jgi:hypothetical protein
MLACLLVQQPALRPHIDKGTQIYQVKLRADRRDYVLAPPAPGPLQVRITGGAPGGKSKLVFAAPLAAGQYALAIRPVLPRDHTIVFSVPVRGEATFVVTAAGDARYDFSFRLPRGTEYRFTFTAPAEGKTFRLAP